MHAIGYKNALRQSRMHAGVSSLPSGRLSPGSGPLLHASNHAPLVVCIFIAYSSYEKVSWLNMCASEPWGVSGRFSDFVAWVAYVFGAWLSLRASEIMRFRLGQGGEA